MGQKKTFFLVKSWQGAGAGLGTIRPEDSQVGERPKAQGPCSLPQPKGASSCLTKMDRSRSQDWTEGSQATLWRLTRSWLGKGGPCS